MKALFCFLFLSLGSLASAALPEALYHKIPNPRMPNQDLDYFGSAMASYGTNIVVGSPRAESDGGAGEGGTVWVVNAYSTSTVQIVDNPFVGGGGRFGHSVAIHETTAVAGAPENGVNGNGNSGAAYFWTVSASAAEPTALVNPNPEGFENFGQAVAITGTHIAVSARGINTAVAGTGTVHLYDRTGGSPTAVAYSIPNPTPASGGFFGETLVLSGTRLIVGNPGALGGRGLVYVYDLASGPPSAPLLTITNPQGTNENELFGCALSLENQTLAVGAREGLGANGRAYVFDLASGTPAVPTISLANPAPFIWEAYGSSVAVRNNRLLVGCPADIQNGNFIGTAYEYDLASATPDAVVFTINSPSSTGVQGGESFGAAVCWGGLSNEFRVIGAPGNDKLQPDAGDIYVLRLLNNALIKSTTSDAHRKRTYPDSNYGEAVCLMGSSMFVADKSARIGGKVGAGCVYQYDLASASPTVPLRRFDNPDPGVNDNFGVTMVTSGTRLVIAASHDKAGTVDKVGTVYVYDLSGPHPALVLTIPNPIVTSQSYFGSALAMDGDRLVINSNSRTRVYDLSSATPGVAVTELGGATSSPRAICINGTRVVIGSHFSDVHGQDAGSVAVYDLLSPTPQTPVLTLSPPAPITQGFFGHVVKLEGDTLVVAAARAAGAPILAGHVYIYDLASATPAVPLYQLTDPLAGSADDRWFGRTFALHGNRVLCGTPFHDAPGANRGEGYLYGLLRSPPEQVAATLQATDGGQFTNLGIAVALNDDWAVMASTETTSPATGPGTIRVYSFPKPEIVVEHIAGVPLVDGASVVDFGYGVQAVPSTLSLTVKNTGIHPLEITAVNFATGNDTDFSTSITGLPLSIPAGGSSIVPVTFTAGVLGARTTELRLLNNDEDEGPFNITLNAFSVTERQAWRQLHFGTIENTGNAANSADPDGDGFDNSFEFLTGSIPVDFHSRFRLDIQPDPTNPGQMRVQISPTRSSTNYRIEFNPDLSPTNWQPLWEGLGTGASQMQVNDVGSLNEVRRFYRAVIW
ncbi:MAG: hypothetical protein JNM99_14235 [Verrucomicrobiaceae bacterium]|nr:hypothetical protein [Verrucomicrobiaceae bacterium]